MGFNSGFKALTDSAVVICGAGARPHSKAAYLFLIEPKGRRNAKDIQALCLFEI